MQNSAQTSDVYLPARMRSRSGVIPARLFLGCVVVVCAEVFSGASVRGGIWNPWIVLVVYPLYYAHFFLLTTLAVRTGRTSLPCLYLWGVLLGMYEAWPTKVIWSGYGGDGKFVMGRIGPYGLSELGMVLFFHPMASFILPLAVACAWRPALRTYFPSLGWLTGGRRGAKAVRCYLMLSFAMVLAMNSGGPVNLSLNLAAVIAVLWATDKWARRRSEAKDDIAIVRFNRWGFAATCVYLALVYGISWRWVRPEALPSAKVQLCTLAFYGVAIAGLWLHRRQGLTTTSDLTNSAKKKLIVVWFGALLAVALALSALGPNSPLYIAIALNSVAWTAAGSLLMVASLVDALRQGALRPAFA